MLITSSHRVDTGIHCWFARLASFVRLALFAITNAYYAGYAGYASKLTTEFCSTQCRDQSSMYPVL